MQGLGEPSACQWSSCVLGRLSKCHRPQKVPHFYVCNSWRLGTHLGSCLHLCVELCGSGDALSTVSLLCLGLNRPGGGPEGSRSEVALPFHCSPDYCTYSFYLSAIQPPGGRSGARRLRNVEDSGRRLLFQGLSGGTHMPKCTPYTVPLCSERMHEHCPVPEPLLCPVGRTAGLAPEGLPVATCPCVWREPCGVSMVSSPLGAPGWDFPSGWKPDPQARAGGNAFPKCGETKKRGGQPGIPARAPASSKAMEPGTPGARGWAA